MPDRKNVQNSWWPIFGKKVHGCAILWSIYSEIVGLNVKN